MTNAEKRSVHTDALETLGTIIEHGERDAIHLAVEPVIAGEKLHPGQDICIHAGEARNVGMGKALGIVDPFLRGPVSKGDKFWLVVYPRQITSLRHVWSHPDFSETVAQPPTVAESEAWLVNWCDTHDCPDWNTVKAAINGENLSEGMGYDYGNSGFRDYGDGDTYIYFGGLDAHEHDIPEEFWRHAENVIGHPVQRAKHFTCSC